MVACVRGRSKHGESRLALLIGGEEHEDKGNDVVPRLYYCMYTPQVAMLVDSVYRSFCYKTDRYSPNQS